jgi:glycosyltransferase involved in cell wall biosynthesis
MSIGSAGALDRDSATSDIALAFVGTAVPDVPRYHSAVFNRAGNNFQLQLIRGLRLNGIVDIEVLSARPIQAYPRSSIAWVPPQREQLGQVPVRLMSFPNVTPLKQFVVGMSVLIGLVLWGWRKRKIRHRVVLTYNLTMPPGIFTFIGARLARAKAVVSVNDINIPGQTVPASTLWRLDLLLQRLLLPMFDGHLAVADQIAKDFFPGRPYVRVEGGIDSAFLERTRRPKDVQRTTGDDFTFVFAGWLNDANGILVVLAAFQLLQGPSFRLRIAGTGPLQSNVEESIRMDPRIAFLGMLDMTGVAALYRDADAVLNVRLTKRIDTRYFFPSKLIECLASGAPTITTGVAHAESEFEGLVYLLHDESPRGLADLMSFVASRSESERLTVANNARAYAATNKTWEVQAARVTRYLRQVVSQSRS